MASSKFLSISSVVGFVILQLAIFVSSHQNLKPEIRSDHEVVVETGDNFTVLCEGNSPLTWTWSQNNMNFPEGIMVSDATPKNTSFTYASRIILQNVTYNYTGFIKCFNKNSNSLDLTEVAEIYLYVEDKNHLSVSDQEVETISVTQYSEAVIPCRPTSPDVNVELNSITGEKLHMDTIYEDGSSYRYDPYDGFITNNTFLLEPAVYYCNFSKGPLSSSVIMILDIELSSYENLKPKILSAYETIVETGNNLTVLCEGNLPLTWTWPKNINYKDGTIVSVSDATPQNKNFKYASRIFMQNVTYDYTGFLKCFNKNINNSDHSQMEEIYLYVEDKNHLSVNDQGIVTVMATQNNEAVIPCKPTSPDVDVELADITGKKIPMDILNEDGTFYHYDPHFGFFTNNTLHVETALYYCHFQKGPQTSSIIIVVEIEEVTDSLPKPLLEETSDTDIIVGGSFVLKCSVRTPLYISMLWWTPTGPINESRMSLSNPTRYTSDKSLISQNLTINNASLQDMGTYFCHITDSQNHYNINSISVKIYDVLALLKTYKETIPRVESNHDKSTNF